MSPAVCGFYMLWELSTKWEQFSDWTLLTLKRQNLRGLNLSFPFLSSKDKNFINCSTNFGSEKWSYIICSACNRKKKWISFEVFACHSDIPIFPSPMFHLNSQGKRCLDYPFPPSFYRELSQLQKLDLPAVINDLILNSDHVLKGNKKVLINTIIPWSLRAKQQYIKIIKLLPIHWDNKN